jgi:Flp pilus assembly pilin Flp
MGTLRQRLRFSSDRRAVTAIEYAIIGVVIAVVSVSGFTNLGSHISAMVSAADTALVRPAPPNSTDRD